MALYVIETLKWITRTTHSREGFLFVLNSYIPSDARTNLYLQRFLIKIDKIKPKQILRKLEEVYLPDLKCNLLLSETTPKSKVVSSHCTVPTNIKIF